MRASRWRRQPVRQVFEPVSNFEAARACSVRKLFNPGINMQLNAVLLCSFVRIVFKPMQLSFQRKIEASNPFQTSKRHSLKGDGFRSHAFEFERRKNSAIALNLPYSNRMPTTIELLLCFSAHAPGLLFGNHDQKKADGYQRGLLSRSSRS